MDRSLKILQHNLNGLRARLTELIKFLSTARYDVLCFQETKLYPGVKDTILPGYRLSRLDRPGAHSKCFGGGLAIYVRTELSYQTLVLHSTEFEVNGVSLSLADGSKIAIVNVYLPPGKNVIEPSSYRNLCEQISNRNVLFCGDFNSKHNAWGSYKQDERGEGLLHFIEDNDMCILNDGRPTLIHNSSGVMSHLDLTIATSNIASNCEWQVSSTETLGSDHLLIDITYRGQIKREGTVGKPKWRIAKADWIKFTENCSQWDVQDIQDADVDVYANNVTIVLMEAVKDAIPRTSGKNRACPKPWWSDACQNAVKLRKKALRRVQRNLNTETKRTYLEATENARKVISEARTSHWHDFCQTLNQHTQIRDVWAKIKSMNGTKSTREIPVETYGDRVGESDRQKADLMAESFADASVAIIGDLVLYRSPRRNTEEERSIKTTEEDQEETMGATRSLLNVCDMEFLRSGHHPPTRRTRY
ncbi:hypothetical protein LOTGIDRAFT_158644 [Lottia gigantea]|uniref:Endonuclease/exonuclease/phosphatase domain-containing protein n=1 Tax=Lottia gigantea TaxID=225164 RepID=V4AQN4_LOTGI|nr:hypothetical protein LOTGIDRAFT_158644 [Lottia gigantea]ESO99552.1 hypothetical protein LOTGIDRAFT_158644 [Lottia gigantea]